MDITIAKIRAEQVWEKFSICVNAEPSTYFDDPMSRGARRKLRVCFTDIQPFKAYGETIKNGDRVLYCKRQSDAPRPKGGMDEKE